MNDHILSVLGLQKSYTCTAPDFRFWDEKDFKMLTNNEYQNSELKERDEFYRMHESILLHIDTGVRIRLLSSEDYSGDIVTYTLISPYILTTDYRKIDITGIDLSRKKCYCGVEEIDFEKIDKN